MLLDELLSDVGNSKVLDVNLCKDSVSCTLGLIWQPVRDERKLILVYLTSPCPPQTKPQALTQVMRIYDPLGILLLFVVKGRTLFQNLWRETL